jgi:hypothetical protein
MVSRREKPLLENRLTQDVYIETYYHQSRGLEASSLHPEHPELRGSRLWLLRKEIAQRRDNALILCSYFEQVGVP